MFQIILDLKSGKSERKISKVNMLNLTLSVFKISQKYSDIDISKFFLKFNLVTS